MSEWKKIANCPSLYMEVSNKIILPLKVEDTSEGATYYYKFGLKVIGSKKITNDIAEWKWQIKNDSNVQSPLITSFRPLSLEFKCQGRHAPTIYGSNGGLNEGMYPPESWRQWKVCPVTESFVWPIKFSSKTGRSSDKYLPFFVIEKPEKNKGYFIGIGWSGDWDLVMLREAETVTITSGMSNLGLSIKPGESFTQPTILIGCYEGQYSFGQKKLRTYLRDYVQPQLNSHRIEPYTCWNHWLSDRGAFFEKDALTEIPLVAEAGFDYFCLDGGWTGGCEDGQWASLLSHIGSWRLSSEKFPSGPGAIVKAAEENKLKLGIWFDIERAHPQSTGYKNNPELFMPMQKGMDCHPLKLHTTEGKDWAFETISKNINIFNAKTIRFDMNNHFPNLAWLANDTPDRIGETEIRYIENLYLLYDALRGAFPDLLIENCASGGHRIDLEIIRRSHSEVVSDHGQAESIVRFNMYGAARWLPINRVENSFAHLFLEKNRTIDWSKPLPASAYLSTFVGVISLGDRLASMGECARVQFRDYIKLFNKTKNCFAGNLTIIGEQIDCLEGPIGFAGTDDQTNDKAFLLFGANKDDASEIIPDEYKSLLDQEPIAGDYGDGQFISSWLWYTSGDV